MDWFDLLTVQGTLKRLLQHHSLKSSILYFTRDQISVNNSYCLEPESSSEPRNSRCGEPTKLSQIMLIFFLLSQFLNCGKVHNKKGFPGGGSKKGPTCQCRRYKRCGFHPWVRKMPWRRAWQSTPVFLPGEQRSLAGSHPRITDRGTQHNIYHLNHF